MEREETIRFIFDNDTEVFPIYSSLSEEMKRIERIGSLQREIKGSLRFIKNDYDFFYELYHRVNGYGCNDFSLKILKKCGSSWVTYFEMYMNLSKGFWNKSECYLEIEPILINPFSCIEDRGDEEVNAFDVATSEVSVKLNGTTESIRCQGNLGEDPTFCSVDDVAWTVIFKKLHAVRHTNGTETTYFDYEYVREYKNSSTPLPYPWINIGGTKYVRPILRYGYDKIEFNPDDNSTMITEKWRYGGNLTNGFLLKDVIQGILNNICPTLTVKSDFFQWNPENSSTINYITEEQSQILNLVLFQRSDVKRPNAGQQATKAMVSFNGLMNDLINMFNIAYDIQGDKFIIEHLSFFTERQQEIDLVNRFDSDIRKGTSAYQKDFDNIPRIEKFKFASENPRRVYDEIEGSPIRNFCAGFGSMKVLEYNVSNIAVNIEGIFEDSSSDENTYSDEGLVLIACDSDNSILMRASQFHVTNTPILNNVLGFPWLHQNYWRNSRYTDRFNMNDRSQFAKSTKMLEKQVEINIYTCCDEAIDFNSNFITELSSSLGKGIIESASLNIIDGSATAIILY